MSHAAIPSTIAPYLRLITERIVQQFQPLKIILFGSYARGDATTNSDLDLLIVMPSGTHKRQQAIAIGQAIADVPISKDIAEQWPGDISQRTISRALARINGTRKKDLWLPPARRGESPSLYYSTGR